ncbi:MAG: GNAT family N-acetyltransferase [Candidatus Binataceae bacterium]|nr:GNAT family N-acetyltransferase [Candidatus Binataceae bacterium]
MAIEVRLLEETDDRGSFQSGDEQLDLFFHRYAGQNQFRHHIGITYVAVESATILGFATVTVGHVEIENLPPSLRKKLPGYPLPILRLARLAVDRNAQGRGVGERLMRTVFSVAIELRDKLGCAGVIVDAKPAAVDYYTRYGFVGLEVVEGTLEERPTPKPMFLPLSAVVQALRIARPRKPD